MHDDWLTAHPRVGSEPPPMPLRMLHGGARAAFTTRVRAAARWAVRQATLRGREVPRADDLVEFMEIGLLGYKTADGLCDDRPNPEPVPPVFWPDPVAAREVVNAAVALYLAGKAWREATRDGQPMVDPVRATATLEARRHLDRTVERLLDESIIKGEVA